MRVTRSLVGDLALALALTLVGVPVTAILSGAHRPGGSGPWPHTGPDPWSSIGAPAGHLGLALVIVTALVLVVRRRWPLITFAAVTVLTSAYLMLGFVLGPILLSFFVVVYTVARHLPLVRSLPAALAAIVLLMLDIFVRQGAIENLLGLMPVSAWVVVPYAGGFVVRQWRESVARDRAEALRQHVDEERLLVAQEVHDIVGHGLAAIKMQADVALHLMAKKPEQAQLALEAISRTSSEALEELRATLAVVRRTDAEAARAPAPTLARLPDLRRRMAEAGIDVEVDLVGPERPVPAIVDLTAYRIVQESLTNVLRHSGAGQATVKIAYQTEELVIDVTNAVNGSPGKGGGLGIPGMRQRAIALGGSFAAGPTDDGRFEVHASLPTGGEE
ncbi:sensor histidine kinase [Fodinicola feengrottensis]